MGAVESSRSPLIGKLDSICSVEGETEGALEPEDVPNCIADSV